MRDLYSRLKDLGFDSKFVQGAVLPDWWADELASTPANRALIEAALVKVLGMNIARLHNPVSELIPEEYLHFRLKKKTKTTDVQKAKATLIVAQQAARAVAGVANRVPAFKGCVTADKVRDAVLQQNQHVTLQSLTNFCWDHGIVVLHLKSLPKGGSKIDGMALFIGNIPVIVLASGKDGPAWLAFYLAHELGHIMERHVTPDSQPIADFDLQQADQDDDERAANRYAIRVLTGRDEVSLHSPYAMTGLLLATAAVEFGNKHRIAPGSVVLFYARSKGHWGAAANALKALSQADGGHAVLAQAMLRHVNPEDLPESSERFLRYVTAI